MGRLYYFLLFLVIAVTKLVSSKVYNADTIENVQNHKNQISRASLIQCGYRYCYSTDILYRKMTGLYCWNKTQVITQYTSISRTCSPTVFNVPITSTVQKKYRPTPIFHRKKKLKQNHVQSTTSIIPHHYRYNHPQHRSRPYPSRPTFYISLATTSTSISIEATQTGSASVSALIATTISVIPSGTPTPFTISEKIINEINPQQQQSNYDFIIVDDEKDNEIDRDNSNDYDADDGTQYNETTVDSDPQLQQQQQPEDEEYEYSDTDNTAQNDEIVDNDYTMNQSYSYVQEQENSIDDSNGPIPSSSISTTSPPLIQTPENQMDDNEQEEEEIIPIISAGMQPIIPGAIPTEPSIGLPQDPNGNSITTSLNEMAVNNTVPNKALGIGLGVGVGCIAALGLVGLLFHTKKRKQEQQQQQDEQPARQYTRWRPQSFMGVVASVVSKLPRSPSQRSKTSSASASSSSSFSSGRAVDPSSSAAPSLTPVDER